jgi:hypothetical protein
VAYNSGLIDGLPLEGSTRAGDSASSERAEKMATTSKTEGKKKPSKNAKRLSVAEFLRQQLALSPKTQKEIALELGYKPNQPQIISMMKEGVVKLPVNKVAPMAKALGIDPLPLLTIVLNEYMPDAWEIIQEAAAKAGALTDEELEVVQKIRTKRAALGAAGMVPLNLKDEKNEKLLDAWIDSLIPELEQREASAKTVEDRPRNARKKGIESVTSAKKAA